MFFSGFTLIRLTFLYVKHYISFIYAYCSFLAYLQAYFLVCLFKSFHTIDIEIFCRMKDYAGCIMYSSLQQSK